MGGRTITAFSLCVLSYLFAGQVPTPSIRETVRKQGDVEIHLMVEYSPVDLRELIRRANLIVQGTVSHALSYLSDHETKVLTDYTIRINRVLKGVLAADEAAKITVRRLGGTLTVDGAKVTAQEADFPAFNVNDDYVLFLKQRGSVYEFEYGGQGAFKVSDGSVTQLSNSVGTWNQSHTDTSLTAFQDEIRKTLLEFAPK